MLFSRKTAEVDDHGESLVQEFEDFIAHIGERVSHRAAVVNGRLASLESELTHLDRLGSKIEQHQK